MRSLLFLAIAGCTEYQIQDPPVVPPAEPPGSNDELGDPPDWNTCQGGWHGQYVNLEVDDPDVTPPRKAVPPTEPFALTWWDAPSFEQFDAGLDFGENWWPVDDGLESDPEYFAVHWRGWLRAVSGTDVTFTLGSADDSWVVLNGQILASQPGIHKFEPQIYTVFVEAGQYPIEVFYASRATDPSGFRFRILSGDVMQCYADYSAQE